VVSATSIPFLPVSPNEGVMVVGVLAVLRETLQYIYKEQDPTWEVFIRHVVDVLAYLTGAVPVAVVLNLLGL